MKMTPIELLDFFTYIAPHFKDYWNSDKNLSVEDDGSFDFHNVCVEFSHYFREQVSFKKKTLLYEKDWMPNINSSKQKELFEFIEENLQDNVLEEEDDLDNALCTCFLENIAKTDSGENAREFMGKKAKQYFDAWNI